MCHWKYDTVAGQNGIGSMKLWNSLKDHFTYTVKEQRGIFVLSVLLMILILIRIGMPRMMARRPCDFSAFEEQFNLLASMITDSIPEDTAARPYPGRSHAPVVRPGNRKGPSGYGPVQESRKPPPVVDLNTADSLTLVRLQGIGPVLARRIIKYRESLGGYHDVWQLQEIYGMDTVTLKKLISSFTVDGSAVRKMDLNAATFKELLHHPYLEYEDVRLIVNYRDKHHPLDSLGQLFEINGLDPDLIRRVQPYLKLGP